MKPPSRLAVVLFLACGLVAISCRDATRQPPRPRGAVKPLELKLERVLVDRVRLTVPHPLAEAATGERELTEAYLVRLQLELPKDMAERIRVFAGDQEIEEYGGWSGGIYFKVYGDAAARAIDGQELSYSFLDQGRRSFGTPLELPPMESLELRPEADVVRSQS